MANMQEYYDIAESVYQKKGQGDPCCAGWQLQKFEWATWYGDGFQGGVITNTTEVIIGFSGTQGGVTTAPVSQNSANLRIGLNVVPNMAGSAYGMVQWAKKISNGRRLSIVGHSLGGGLAQVVGNWASIPFISLNGPGMKSHLRASAFNILKPLQMFRSATSQNADDSAGICFTVKGDAIGEFGYHVGYEKVIVSTSKAAKHSLDAIYSGLQGADLRDKSPRDILSIWPA